MVKKISKPPAIKLKKSTISKLKKADLQQVNGGTLSTRQTDQTTHPNTCSQVVSCD